MKEFQYTIKDACGIHARPAGLLVKTVKGFASSATLEKDGKSCDMRKLMALWAWASSRARPSPSRWKAMTKRQLQKQSRSS